MQKYTKQDKIKFDKLLGNREKESEIERNFYKKTEKYLKFIKWVPGLKMVGIGNSISMCSASKDSDIDLLIVTSNNSMWFVRIFVTLIFQILQVRKDEKNHAGRFCLSFFCTIDGLDFSSFSLEKDPYLYFWILYFKPILDYNNTYNLFIEKNKSWTDFSEYEDIFQNNKKYIKYKKNNFKNSFSTEGFSPLKIVDFFIKKIFLPKTLKHYERIGKPYGVIINDDMLKFHNGDIRDEISSKFKYNIMKIKIYGKSEQKENPDFLEGVIFPNQTHSNNIVEIITGKENLENCDGIFTSIKNNYKLAIRTADCTAITFYDKKNYGIIHAGWRGLTNGIIEKMLEKFDNPEIYVAPFLKKFEIQKDFCYQEIFEKFGDKYFDSNHNLLDKEIHNKIIFNFEGALKSIIGNKSIIDKKNTLEEKNLYSWRENKTLGRNYTIIENNGKK